MNDPSADVGVAFGRILLPFALLLWGMQKCRTAAARPGSNRHAFEGLMFSLGAWAFLLLQNAFSAVLPPAVSVVLMGGVVIAGLWGAARGLTGLFASSRLGAAAQAATAVLVGLGLAALIGYGVYSGWSSARAAALAKRETPEVLALPAFGFSYRVPGGQWLQVDVAKVNPNAKLAFGRRAMAFVIMAERGADEQASGADLMPWLRTSLEQQGAISRFEDVPHRVGPYQGTRVLAHVPARRYVVWLYGAGGRLFALMLSTSDAAVPEAELLAEAEGLFSGFSTSP